VTSTIMTEDFGSFASPTAGIVPKNHTTTSFHDFPIHNSVRYNWSDFLTPFLNKPQIK